MYIGSTVIIEVTVHEKCTLRVSVSELNSSTKNRVSCISKLCIRVCIFVYLLNIFIFRVCIVYFANCLIVYSRVFNILKIKYSIFKLIHN